MYYPYFFSNKFEMETIFRLKKEIEQGLVLPIVEMYKVSSGTVKTTAKIANSKTPFILILNPYNQRQEKVDKQSVQDLIDSLANSRDTKIIFGIYLDKNNLDFCDELINKHSDRDIALFHRNIENIDLEVMLKISKKSNVRYNFFYGDATRHMYHTKFDGLNKIILEDAFSKKTPNSEYKNSEDEVFYNLHRTYKDLGFDGFGDYLTIGNAPSDSRGQQPSTVVIHYTYPDGKNHDNIRIKRFFGDVNKEHEKTSDGILKAMQDAKTFIETYIDEKCELCDECKELITKTRRGKSHDLGKLKQFSMLHHVNMIIKLIDSRI